MVRGKITEDQKTFEKAVNAYPHFKSYVDEISATIGEPKYYLDFDFFKYYKEQFLKQVETDGLNLIYPVGDQLFIHILKFPGENYQYIVIEPELQGKTKTLYNQILDKMIEKAQELPTPDRTTDIKKVIIGLLDSIVEVSQ